MGRRPGGSFGDYAQLARNEDESIGKPDESDSTRTARGVMIVVSFILFAFLGYALLVTLLEISHRREQTSSESSFPASSGPISTPFPNVAQFYVDSGTLLSAFHHTQATGKAVPSLQYVPDYFPSMRSALFSRDTFSTKVTTEPGSEWKISPKIALYRREVVRGMFRHAWDNYARLCPGADEIRPLTGTCSNWLFTAGSAIDAVTTLILMNEHARLNQSLEILDFVDFSISGTHQLTRFPPAVVDFTSDDHNTSRFVSFFETNIRVLGSFLSLYDLTEDPQALQRAIDVAERLMPTFNWSPSGIPTASFNIMNATANPNSWCGFGCIPVADFATIQLEFCGLSAAIERFLQKPGTSLVWNTDPLDSSEDLKNNPLGADPLHVPTSHKSSLTILTPNTQANQSNTRSKAIAIKIRYDPTEFCARGHHITTFLYSYSIAPLDSSYPANMLFPIYFAPTMLSKVHPIVAREFGLPLQLSPFYDNLALKNLTYDPFTHVLSHIAAKRTGSAKCEFLSQITAPWAKELAQVNVTSDPLPHLYRPQERLSKTTSKSAKPPASPGLSSDAPLESSTSQPAPGFSLPVALTSAAHRGGVLAGQLSAVYSFGPMGDSAYEYLLKTWISTGKTNPMYLDMYRTSMRSMLESSFVEFSPLPSSFPIDLGNQATFPWNRLSPFSNQTMTVPTVETLQSLEPEFPGPRLPPQFNITKPSPGVLGSTPFMPVLANFSHFSTPTPPQSPPLPHPAALLEESRYNQTVMELLSTDWAFIPDVAGFSVGRNRSHSKFTGDTMNHLACFLPGILALGVEHGAVSGEEAKQHLHAAKLLVKGCARGYIMSPVTGLAPEVYQFDANGLFGATSGSQYNLRPETMESLYLLYRVTGDRFYRELMWIIISSIEIFSKVSYGYANIEHVQTGVIDDRQETFVFAEVFKYAFLAFEEGDSLIDDPLGKLSSDPAPSSSTRNSHRLVNLNTLVFNTEAHPIRASDYNIDQKLFASQVRRKASASKKH